VYLYLVLLTISIIILAYFDNNQWSCYQRDLVRW